MAAAVAERGYARTSVADVAVRAGVSTRAFYEQFADKEECFLAAYDAGVGALLAAARDALDDVATSSPLVRFERALAAYLDVMSLEPHFARTFLLEVYAAGPRALELRREVQRRFVEVMVEALGSGRGGGDAPAEERFACEALVGAVSSLVTARVAAGEYDDLPALRRPIMGLVERHLYPRRRVVRAPRAA